MKVRVNIAVVGRAYIRMEVDTSKSLSDLNFMRYTFEMRKLDSSIGLRRHLILKYNSPISRSFMQRE